jgi:hypothetical protein
MTLTIRPGFSVANGPFDNTKTETAPLQPLPAHIAIGAPLTDTHPSSPGLPSSASGNASPLFDGLGSVGALYGTHVALLAQSARPPVPALNAERAMRPIGSDPTDPGPSEPVPPPSPPSRP